MHNEPLTELISDLVLELVRQQKPSLANTLKLLTLSSGEEAWKEAGDELLELAIKIKPIVDAQFWFALACGCFERYVTLGRLRGK